MKLEDEEGSCGQIRIYPQNLDVETDKTRNLSGRLVFGLLFRFRS